MDKDEPPQFGEAAKPYSFREMIGSLSSRDWATVYGRACYRVRLMINSGHVPGAQIAQGGLSSLSKTKPGVDLANEDHDYVMQAIVYLYSDPEKKQWADLNHVWRYIARKAKQLVLDVAKARKRGKRKTADGTIVEIEFSSPHELLEKSEQTSIDLHKLAELKETLSHGGRTDADALKLLEYLERPKEHAGDSAYKAHAIAEALGWNLDRYQRARARLIAQAKRLNGDENE